MVMLLLKSAKPFSYEESCWAKRNYSGSGVVWHWIRSLEAIYCLIIGLDLTWLGHSEEPLLGRIFLLYKTGKESGDLCLSKRWTNIYQYYLQSEPKMSSLWLLTSLGFPQICNKLPLPLVQI